MRFYFIRPKADGSQMNWWEVIDFDAAFITEIIVVITKKSKKVPNYWYGMRPIVLEKNVIN